MASSAATTLIDAVMPALAAAPSSGNVTVTRGCPEQLQRDKLVGMAPRSFIVRFEPDGGGWHVSVPSLQGCRAWGRSLGEARRHIREAISLCDEELGNAVRIARDAILEEDIKLPTNVRGALRRIERAREQRAKILEKLRTEEREAVSEIAATFSLRDTAALLGVSHQAIKKQLAKGRRPPK